MPSLLPPFLRKLDATNFVFPFGNHGNDMSLHVYTPVEGGRMIKIAFVFFFLDTVVFFFLERSGSSRGIPKTFEIIVTLKKKINLIKLIVYLTNL